MTPWILAAVTWVGIAVFFWTLIRVGALSDRRHWSARVAYRPSPRSLADDESTLLHEAARKARDDD